MESLEQLRDQYARLEKEGTQLAGRLTDLGQRATVYHSLFEASGRNHIFPLIAAHGALWAGPYFRFCAKLGNLMSLRYVFQPDKRREKLHDLAEFTNVFRKINQAVCIDTYANFHFTKLFGEHPLAGQVIPQKLLSCLQMLHAANRDDRELTDGEKRMVFRAHFLNEQETVVGPSIAAAVDRMDWPLVKAIALRPVIRFAYFPGQTRFWFRDFTCTDERIEKGMKAFETAAAVGWEKTEAALASYRQLPPAFFVNPVQYFADVKATVLT